MLMFGERLRSKNGLTLRSSRPRAVRWPGASAPRASQVRVSVPLAPEGTRPAERKNVGRTGARRGVSQIPSLRITGAPAALMRRTRKHGTPRCAVATGGRCQQRTRCAAASATSAPAARETAGCGGSRPCAPAIVASIGIGAARGTRRPFSAAESGTWRTHHDTPFAQPRVTVSAPAK